MTDFSNDNSLRAAVARAYKERDQAYRTPAFDSVFDKAAKHAEQPLWPTILTTYLNKAHPAAVFVLSIFVCTFGFFLIDHANGDLVLSAHLYAGLDVNFPTDTLLNIDDDLSNLYGSPTSWELGSMDFPEIQQYDI